jgi:hypothetical protein
MDFNFDIDILGQTPFLMRLYTQICFCYPITDPSSHPIIIDTLKNGLHRLVESFPWLGGQVVHEGAGEGNQETYKIVPLKNFTHLVVKDLRNDPSMPSLEELRKANYPFSMFDENVICPRPTLPSGVDNSAPVFMVQANFINGGLMLSIVAQHNTMDMTGQGAVIELYSKACHSEEFTAEELSSGNLARENLVPFIESYQRGPELEFQIAPPAPAQPDPKENVPPLSPPPCSWAYFAFDASSLAALKALATKTLPSGFISTDDALSAFIWQGVTRARLPRLSPTDFSTFARAIDVRDHLGLPRTYPGLMQNMAYNKSTYRELIDESLGVIAYQLRSQLDPKKVDMAYKTRALATYFAQAEDKTKVGFTATIDPSSDIMLSSWAKVNCYALDFGLGLGKPESVRRPRFVPFESLIYLMPKANDGGIAAAISLRNEDMERLRADKEFTRFGMYVG